MRVRIPEHLEHRIRSLALREGRSDQSMLDRIVTAGLGVTGHPAAVMSPALGDLSDSELTEMKIPLDANMRANLRALAAEHGRSQRQLASRILAAGLKKLGADAATVDATTTTA
jgi:hypothetical protein